MRHGRTTRAAIGASVALSLALAGYIPQARASHTHAPVSVSVWTAFNGAQAKAFNELINRFQAKNPDIKVQMTSSNNYGALATKEQSAIVANNVPTIGQAYENVVTTFAAGGAVQELSPYVNNKKTGLSKKEIADFYAGVWRDGLLGKQRDMMPFSKSDEVLYFNGPMLRRFGIKSPPATWSQFAADCKKVTKGGSHPTSWCMTLEEYTSNFYTWEYEWGNKVLKGQHAAINSKSGAAPLTFWRDLVKKHEVVVGTTPNYPGQADFDAGKAAFYVGSSAGLTYVVAGAVPGVGVGVRVYPGGPKGQATELYGGNMFMFKNIPADQKQAGWLFLKFITTPQSTAYWAETTGYMPIRKSANKLADLKVFYKQNPQLRAAPAQLDHGLLEPTFSGWTKARNDITTIVTSALQGGRSPQQAVKDLTQQLNSDMSQ